MTLMPILAVAGFGLMAITALVSRRHHQNITTDEATLLVYAHPLSIPQGTSQSTPKGRDDYFGDLMTEIPSLKRLLHGDSSLADILINLVLAAVMSAILSVVYVRYGTSFSNRRALGKTFYLLLKDASVVRAAQVVVNRRPGGRA